MSLRQALIEAKIAERSHYEHRGYRDPETGEFDMCRIWDGPTSGDAVLTRGHGYGRMNLDGATVAVHIAAWVNVNGLIPPRKQLDHLCHQRDCCEERHLKLKTHKQNQKNKRAKMGVHGEIGPTGRRGTPICEAEALKMRDDFRKAHPCVLVGVDLSEIEGRVIAQMLDSGKLDGEELARQLATGTFETDAIDPKHLENFYHGGTVTGRFTRDPDIQYFKPTDPLAQEIIDGVREKVIGHDIPAEFVPPAAAEVTDE